ncbi:recombination-associated protein RdgC [Oceanicoccus sagamiensis]|uniref:Recombination-associated protein RdgC n=1 Tax=Oceanicoccus sagamiensis TaxID=716816 RepID=A0A1X9NA45_9GAMM|nr:recombination-associated protein RdgC [Oceanicoccus sagamiensis]ARN74930.1 recombination-associated protein RdgC [Oceanicoccus sagamiensis]
MWFKNLQVYRFTKPFDLSPEALSEQLEEYAFQPCGSQDLSRYGWVSPLGHHGSEYVHAAAGYIMICAKKQDKVLPASVVNEQVVEKALAIQTEEGRSVGRKERANLKEEITFELLPKAFARSSLQFAYIAPKEGLLVVNSASSKRAEELISYLRETIGTVPVIPITPNNIPQHVMTAWLKSGHAPKGFEFGHECELKDPTDEGGVIRCKHQDLTSSEINNHIKAGMYVSKLGLSFSGGIEFVVDDTLAIKRLAFADLIQEKANQVDAHDAAEQFDVDFAIMTLELAALIAAVIEVFGGENSEAIEAA